MTENKNLSEWVIAASATVPEKLTHSGAEAETAYHSIQSFSIPALEPLSFGKDSRNRIKHQGKEMALSFPVVNLMVRTAPLKS
jgi:hypothetical protein